MLSATAADGLIATMIILAMSFGLIVPKMSIDYFSDRAALLKARAGILIITFVSVVLRLRRRSSAGR
jgi:hypothetical protein